MSATSVSPLFIYQSRVNLLELLETQGMNIDDYNEFSYNEVHVMHQNKQLDMLLESNEAGAEGKIQPVRPNKKVYVKYHLAKTLRPAHVEEYIDDIFNIEQILNKEDDLIIVVRDEPNDTLVNLLKHIWERDGIFLILFNIKRLQYNVLKHALVPKHRVLTADEIIAFKQKYNLNDSQYPEISRFDPVMQALGVRPKVICEITRSSKTAISSTYYRICC